ncbi:hypothetical protein MMC12_000798 [Toensbergia leucococca]|nr:hypothetical protein [Toensbergia leucococca]
MSLADYTKPTVSLSLRWITFLTLSNVICSRTDLVKLSQLTNLGALTIGKGVGCPESNFDDGIIRSWSRAATEADAFSMLRVLTCCSQKDITTKSFVYLKQFPSLTFFNVEDCDLCSGDQMKIETLGWKSKTLKGLGPWLQIGRGVTRGWDLTIRACFQHGRALHLEDQTVEAILATDLLPVLHLSLGDYDLDAEFNMGGDKIMKCFRRLIHPKARPAGSTRSSKRTPNELENSREVPRKKMMIRASKKHNLEDLLTSLGT